MEKILESKATIRLQHCDPFKHLNNIYYLDYFFNARVDQMREVYGIDILREMNNVHLVWVISSNQIAYLRPAGITETVIIESQLIAKTPRSLLVEMRMLDEGKTHLKAVLWTEFIYFNLHAQKAATHSSEMAKLFDEILLPVEQKNFDERKVFFAIQNSRFKSSVDEYNKKYSIT